MKKGITARTIREEQQNKCETGVHIILTHSFLHQHTPAYCHGNVQVPLDVWFEHSHQFPVQVDGFCCHPEKHSQEEVVQECRRQPTEHRNSS